MYANNLNLNSKGKYSSSERETKFHRCLCTFSIKHKITHFYVIVGQKWQRNVQKSMMHTHDVLLDIVVAIASLNLKVPTVVSSSWYPYSMEFHFPPFFVIQKMASSDKILKIKTISSNAYQHFA